MKKLVILSAPCGVGKSTIKDELNRCGLLPEDIEVTFFIGMVCSDEEIHRRLKARPAERMCGDDEFIKAQIEYSEWYKENKGKFQFFLDNTGMEISQTAEMIAEFMKKL